MFEYCFRRPKLDQKSSWPQRHCCFKGWLSAEHCCYSPRAVANVTLTLDDDLLNHRRKCLRLRAGRAYSSPCLVKHCWMASKSSCLEWYSAGYSVRSELWCFNSHNLNISLSDRSSYRFNRNLSALQASSAASAGAIKAVHYTGALRLGDSMHTRCTLAIRRHNSRMRHGE